jgi:hypothetical protein
LIGEITDLIGKNTMLKLLVLQETIGIARLRAGELIPDWAQNGIFFSITRTIDELSVVCEEKYIPNSFKSERGWRCFKVEGPLDFGLTGILSSLASPLAIEKISIFAISTYDTDYLLVKKENFEKAKEILGKFCEIRDVS